MYRALSHPFLIDHYKFIAIVITLCLPASCASHANADLPVPLSNQTVLKASLVEADRLFSHRSDVNSLRLAVSGRNLTAPGHGLLPLVAAGGHRQRGLNA